MQAIFELTQEEMSIVAGGLHAPNPDGPPIPPPPTNPPPKPPST